MLREIVATTEIPYAQFLPTHVNRNETLFLESMEYALQGGIIDMTAGPLVDGSEVKASRGLKRCLDHGVPAERITLTSDGQGSVPIFDEHKVFIRLAVSQVDFLFQDIRDAILQEGIAIETAIRTITRTPAEIYRLKGKGRIQPDFDADLVLVDPSTFELDTVIAKGRTLMLHKQVKATGTFE